MSQSSGKGVLNDAVKTLHLAWQRCRVNWTDSIAEKFERDFIAPIDPAARRAHEAMDRLQSVTNEAIRACE